MNILIWILSVTLGCLLATWMWIASSWAPLGLQAERFKLSLPPFFASFIIGVWLTLNPAFEFAHTAKIFCAIGMGLAIFTSTLYGILRLKKIEVDDKEYAHTALQNLSRACWFVAIIGLALVGAVTSGFAGRGDA